MTPELSVLSPREETNSRSVLIVDDNPMDLRLARQIVELGLRWRVESADNGREALASVDKHAPDVILTDLFMPELDGLELVEAVRERSPTVPVVLMTGRGNEEIALRALRAGAASYVPKKRLVGSLVETLDQVAMAARNVRRRQRLLECVTHTESSFVLENDRALVATLVATLQDQLGGMRLVDDCERLRVGVALEEALTNALYHGNLGVSSELKERDDAAFLTLAEQRRRQSPYRERRIFVQARLTPSEATISIRDEGDGFDPSNLPDPTDPKNLDRPSGRGLLLIRTFMDDVRHNTTGNQITMVKRRKAAC
jgi:CheY-like chemotaxis protein/anti-sigma regulatory factor (Ser/Thr protein kinase)